MDGVVRALVPENLMVVVAVVTDAAREARRRHQLARVSAAVLAQGLASGVLLASLQKEDSRINVQLECDGPLKGFFVDASPKGDVRGYVKSTHLDVELGQGPFRWRAALGNSGFLSVLRDIGDEYYRSSVELKSMDVGRDLNSFFAVSEQVATRVALGVASLGDEPLGTVAGALIQALPGDEHAPLPEVEALQGRLDTALRDGVLTPLALLRVLMPAADVSSQYPVTFRCACSRERVLTTLAAMGKDEIQSIIDTLGSTAVTCHLCSTRYEVTLPDLLELLERSGGAVG